MNGLVFDIRSFSVHDGPGIRQTIFLKGCPLRCKWCHNPESQEKAEEMIITEKILDGKTFSKTEKVGKIMSVAEIMESVNKDIPFYEESGGGVTLSGGEPLMQPHFTIALLKACKTNNIHTALDTCGYADAAHIEGIIPFTDLLLYDLKLADAQEHVYYTGVNNFPVLENLKIISKAGKKIIIRIPIIPGITDTIANLEALRRIIESTAGVIRIDLLPYHSGALNKYNRMGKNAGFENKTTYNMSLASAIQEFFSNSAPVVSIGG